METMGEWRVRIPVYGVQSVLRKTGEEITENNVKFNYRTDQEIVGDVRVDKEDAEDAINEAVYLIDNALARICFAYNRESTMSENSSYVTDLSKDNSRKQIRKALRIRWNYVKENPQTTSCNISSLDSEKSEVTDLALAYYKA